MKRPELRLIRDALEAVLSPELAAGTLDQALRAMPDALASSSETVALVHGPLRAALTKHHGAAADDVIDDLLRMLVSRAPAPSGRAQDATREIALVAQVLVFVLSSSEQLAEAIQQGLGTEHVTTLTYDEAARVRKAIAFKAPAIAIVDGAGFPRIEPSSVPEILEALPPTSVRAVWGTDTPYGASVVASLASRRAAFTPLDRREGIAPVLDLVRARRQTA